MINKYIKKKSLIKITIIILLLIIICLPVFYPIEVKGRFVPYEYTIHGTYIEINRYTGTEAEVEIPAYLWFRPVKEISSKYLKGAFEDLDYVTSIKMPNTVTKLSNGPFWGCWNLEEIVLSKNISIISAGTFSNCDKLTEIIFYEKIEEIRGDAIADCDVLERVIFYNPDTKIDKIAFDNGVQSCNFDILTLVSAKDSAVERYAKEHGIKWEELKE